MGMKRQICTGDLIASQIFNEIPNGGEVRFVLCIPEVVLEDLLINVRKYSKIRAAGCVMDHLSRDQRAGPKQRLGVSGELPRSSNLNTK